MSRDQRISEKQIEQLLADDQYAGHPLQQALKQLWKDYVVQRSRLDRITHLSDAYQSMARQRESDLDGRFTKQVRQLEKLARISDRYQQMMRDLNLALNDASNRDVLTGLGNRRLLMQRLKEETDRSNRSGRSYSLALLDVDHFKLVNDTHGHEMGDQVLVEIGAAVQVELREYDLCGRWGGEEFLVILPDSGAAAALSVAERVRNGIRNLVVPTPTQAVTVSASIGVSTHIPGEDYSLTVGRADAALLEAKRNGRDRTIVAEPNQA